MDTNRFVFINDEIPEIIIELRYYSSYNFVGERITGYDEPYAIVTKETAVALKKVTKELLSNGYLLKLYDAYRPQMAVDHFISWSNDLTKDSMKKYFYPKLTKQEIFNNHYLAKRSPHSRGSTVDVTLFDMSTGKDVDMGGVFDLFDRFSYAYSDLITEEQNKNRELLRSTMEKYGFSPYEKEWWHFTLVDEPFPHTTFNFPIRKPKNSIE